jgi:predicted RNA-binding protein with PUA-like domain
MQYWLIKSEPSSYSIEDMARDKRTYWDGVRNYQARNNMKEMKKGDLAFFYRSVKKPAIVGIVEIVKEAYQDPTTDDDRWVVVDIELKRVLDEPILLSDVKAESALGEMRLVKQSRLSVSPVTAKEWAFIEKKWL